jgi:hypothetical protein
MQPQSSDHRDAPTSNPRFVFSASIAHQNLDLVLYLKNRARNSRKGIFRMRQVRRANSAYSNLPIREGLSNLHKRINITGRDLSQLHWKTRMLHGSMPWRQKPGCWRACASTPPRQDLAGLATGRQKTIWFRIFGIPIWLCSADPRSRAFPPVSTISH